MKVINTGSNAAVMTIQIPEKGSVYARDERNPKLLLKLSKQKREYVQLDKDGKETVLGAFMQIGRAQAVLKLDDKIDAVDGSVLTKIKAAEKKVIDAEEAKAKEEADKEAQATAKKVAKEAEAKAKAAEKADAKK